MKWLFCFLGFHKFEEYYFKHCDDMSFHGMMCCERCGAFYSKEVVKVKESLHNEEKLK